MRPRVRGSGPGAEAVIAVTARLVNDAHSAQRMLIDTRIENASGVSVAADRRGLRLEAGACRTATFTMRISQPRLWRGTVDPYLYAVVVALRDTQGSTVDRVRQPLGVRSLRFDPNERFFLNGEHRVLRGVSVHQDRPVKGWAVSRADREEDFRIIAELGANAVRFAHYPHDNYAYELADRQGLVAWAEIPLVNQVSLDGSAASPALAANARQQGDQTDINDKGLVSYDRRIRKDAFYFYRANWSAQPTLHLTGRRYTKRPHAVIDVTAYSNAERAALWVNDALQGDALCSVGTCVWRGVRLSPGVNQVRAEADVAGAKLVDELRWKLTDATQ